MRSREVYRILSVGRVIWPVAIYHIVTSEKYTKVYFSLASSCYTYSVKREHARRYSSAGRAALS